MSNHPETDNGRTIVREFEQWVPHLMVPKGICPLPMVVMDGPDHFQLIKLELNDPEAYRAFLYIIQKSETRAAMFGLDRIGDPDTQRIEMSDLLTVVLYERSESRIHLTHEDIRDRFRYGIILYHYSPRVIRPINWENTFWRFELQGEMNRYLRGQERTTQRIRDLQRLYGPRLRGFGS